MVEAQKYADLRSYLKTVSNGLFCIIKKCMEQKQGYSSQLYTNDSIIAQMKGLRSRFISGPAIRELRQKYQYVSEQTFKVMLELHLLKQIPIGSSAQLQYLLPQTQQAAVRNYTANSYSLSSQWKQQVSVLDKNQTIYPNSISGSDFFSSNSKNPKAVVPSPSNSKNRLPGFISFKKVHTEQNQDANYRPICQKKIIVLRQNRKQNGTKAPTSRFLANAWIGMDDYRTSTYFAATISRQRSIDENFYGLLMQRFNAEDQKFFSIHDNKPPLSGSNSMGFTEQHTNFCFNLIYQYALEGTEQLVFRGDFQNFNVPFYLRWIVGGKTRGRQIGHFKAVSVKEKLGVTALYAACPSIPLEIHKIQDFELEITQFTKTSYSRGIFDWRLGCDGIYIDCQIDGFHLQSCLLPNIIKERKLSKKQAIKELLKNANYEGDLAYVVKRIRVNVFESQTTTLHYKDTRLRKNQERLETNVRKRCNRNKRSPA